MWLIVGQMPIKAGCWDAFLALWDFSQSNKHFIQLSTTCFVSLLQCPHFISSHPELFCKKDVLKNFAKFIGDSSGRGVCCEFCDILKNTFFRRTPPVTVSCTNKSAAEAWICLVYFYGGAKDFISTCIFHKVITFFIKI